MVTVSKQGCSKSIVNIVFAIVALAVSNSAFSANECNEFEPKDFETNAEMPQKFNYLDQAFKLAPGNSPVGLSCKMKNSFWTELVGIVAEEYRFSDDLTGKRTFIAQRMADRLREWQADVDYENLRLLIETANSADPFGSNQKWMVGSLMDSIMNTLIQECSTNTISNECNNEYRLVRDRMIFATFMNNLGDVQRHPLVVEEVKKFNKRSAQWDAYLDNQQFQYLWELSLNYCRDNKNITGWKYVGCYVPLVGAGIAQADYDKKSANGWERVPTSRFIYLHPEIGAVYDKYEADDWHIKPSFIFEWIGVMNWKWNDSWTEPSDKIYSCKWDICPWGFSLVSQYANFSQHKDLGHGAAIHFRNYTITYTRHDSEFGGKDEWFVGVNISLSKLLGEGRNNNWKPLQSLFIGTN